MGEIARIENLTYYNDLCELMKNNGDMVQVDGIWIPVDKPRHVYIYRQEVNKNGCMMYYYTDFSSVTRAMQIISTEKSNSFGEVVMYGELFCVTGLLHISYAHILTCVRSVLTQLLGKVVVKHTEYPSDSGNSMLHIFRVKKNEKFLYWNIADMHKIMNAVCYHIDKSTGQFYGEMYTKVDEYLFKPIINLGIYTPMRHMILPGCNNLEKDGSYKMVDSAISRHINVDIDDNWELGVIPYPIQEYDQRLAIVSREIFNQVMDKYGIEIDDKMPWPCEHYGHIKKCPNDGNECTAIIKVTPHDLKAFYKCENSTAVVLHKFDHSEIQVYKKEPTIEVFDDYLNLNHHITRPNFAIQSLKQVLVYDLPAKKIAIKKKNIGTQLIYWEYLLDDTFFANYKRKVRNGRGEFTMLKNLIMDYAHEFSAKIVWVPYSWKYKPDGFENYSSCVNQYPKPREPQNEMTIDLHMRLSKLFKDDCSIHKFIMFMAMVIQKPHLDKKFHLILHNGCLETLVPICMALLCKEVVRVSRIEQILNTPQCTLCIVSNYEGVKLDQSTYKNSMEFFANRVFKRADWEMNIKDRFSTCYVISIHSGESPIHRQLNEGNNEIYIDMNYSHSMVNLEGVYEYLLDINESKYNELGNYEQLVTSIPRSKNENISTAYIRLISQNKRPAIICGNSYSVNEVYEDYSKYAHENNIKPVDKTVFGKTCKKYGILRKRTKTLSLLHYKYFIPVHINM